MEDINKSNGRVRIDSAFKNAQKEASSALMPYFTLGYPDAKTSLEIIEAIAPYSDLLELGIPFSDPLADGPTIQHSTQVSLENGTTTAGCLKMLRHLRQRGIETPVMLMGYYNPMLAYGLERFVADAADAGADGFIVPDLPPEEAGELEALAAASSLALIYFLAPTSNEARIQNVIQRASGFIYLVRLTGVTGAQTGVQADLVDLIQRVRGRSPVPLAVGFGISTPEMAAQIGQVADGVIVGSALINVADQTAGNKPAAVAAFVRRLKDALIQ